jgi:hypothetical protein
VGIGVVVFYVAFLWWAVATFARWRRHGRAEVTNLDAEASPATRVRPAFSKENVEEKEEVVRRAEAYRTPTQRTVDQIAANARGGGGGGFVHGLTKLAGVLVLLLGVGFVGLLVYGLVVRPKESGPGLGEMVSGGAMKTLLATHWLVIVFTLIRTGTALVGMRAKKA